MCLGRIKNTHLRKLNWRLQAQRDLEVRPILCPGVSLLKNDSVESSICVSLSIQQYLGEIYRVAERPFEFKRFNFFHYV